VIEDGALRMGLTHVAKLRTATVVPILEARAGAMDKKFTSLADFMTRTGVHQEVLDYLSAAGALDSFDELAVRGKAGVYSATDSDAAVGHNSVAGTLVADRRHLRWESGLRYRPRGEKKGGVRQLALDMPVEQDMVALPKESDWDRMIGEYSATGVYPEGHLMMKVRPHLPENVIRSDEVRNYANGDRISVAGLVIRRQKPNGKTVFITLEDEFGLSPLIIWPTVYQRFKLQIKEPLLLATGTISRREGTMNIVVETIRPISESIPQYHSRDWG